jgi:hypothetical protein
MTRRGRTIHIVTLRYLQVFGAAIRKLGERVSTLQWCGAALSSERWRE